MHSKRLACALLLGSVLMTSAVLGELRAASPQASHAPLPLDKTTVFFWARDHGDQAGARLEAIEQRGIDFEPTDDFLQTLRTAGASEAFVEAVRNAKSPQRTLLSAEGPLDPFQIVLLAIDGVSDQRTLALLKQRGINGHPSPEHLDFLRKLGVKETVIEALRTAQVHVESGDRKAINQKHARFAEEGCYARFRSSGVSIRVRELLAWALNSEGKNDDALDILGQMELQVRERLERESSPLQFSVPPTQVPERDSWNPPLGEQLSFVLDLEGNAPPGLAANQASAVGSLRILNTAAIIYATTYFDKGFPESLSALAPPTDRGAPATADAARLIDPTLASGTKNGYVFTFTPGERNAAGQIRVYTIHADPVTPGTTGKSHYFTDQTGVIRRDSDKPANEQSRWIDY